MKKIILAFVSILLLWNCSEKPAAVQPGEIRGTVIDAVSLNALGGAVVGLSSGESRITGTDGAFHFADINAGEYVLTFSKDGYTSLSRNVSVTSGKTTRVDIALNAKSGGDNPGGGGDNPGGGGDNPGGGGDTPGGGGDNPGGGIVVPQGLLAYYTFDDGTFNDSCENELDGVGHENPSFIDDTPSGKGKAVALKWSKKQYITIPYNPLSPYYYYTISFWIKDFTFGVIFSALSSGDVSMNYPDLVRSDYPRLLSTLTFKFRFFTGYDNWDTTEPFSQNTEDLMNSGWHHIALTCENTTRYLYIDGRLVDTNQSYAHGEPYTEWTPDTFMIGGDKGGIYEQGIDMKFDNLRFYSVALPKEKIVKVYESEK